MKNNKFNSNNKTNNNNNLNKITLNNNLIERSFKKIICNNKINFKKNNRLPSNQIIININSNNNNRLNFKNKAAK